MGTSDSQITSAAQQTISIPLTVAQWLFGGFFVGMLGAGGSYVGSSATSPDVFALQIQQLDAKVVELQSDIKALQAAVTLGTADQFTRKDAERELGEIRGRVLALERKHPDLFDNR